MAETLHARVEVLRRLARRGAVPGLRRTLLKSRPEDVADAIEHMAPAEQRLVLGQIDSDVMVADVLAQVEQTDFDKLVRMLSFDRLVRVLDQMEVDDEADVIARLPDDLRARVLEAIEEQDKAHVEDIMAWPEDSAGGIMQPIAFRLNEGLTTRDAINALHEKSDELEMVFYVYVENDAGQLVGVTSLRALLTHPPSARLSDIITTDVITVAPDTDQEEVARIVGRYDLLAVPVVDQGRNLLGIVTIDDVVDVIKEEAAEDMMLMAGVGDDLEIHMVSVLSSARQRLPWLVVTLVGGLGMAEVIHFFQSALAKEAVLAGFIPVMMGMGGNVGIQAATIAVRNITTGLIDARGALGTLFREARVGALLGLSFALALGLFAMLRTGEPMLGLAIAISVLTELICATMVGAAIPLIMNRFGADPAVATGPFVTTTIDLVSLLVYFTTCVHILGL